MAQAAEINRAVIETVNGEVLRRFDEVPIVEGIPMRRCRDGGRIPSQCSPATWRRLADIRHRKRIFDRIVLGTSLNDRLVQSNNLRENEAES